MMIGKCICGSVVLWRRRDGFSFHPIWVAANHTMRSEMHLVSCKGAKLA